MGNLYSVRNMIKYLGYEAAVTRECEEILKADKLILPGVGNFGKAMQAISSMNLQNTLNEKVIEQRTPILGICLGMQLLTDYSEEGECSGLGWISGKVKHFDLPNNFELKVPHMGWDNIQIQSNSNLVQQTELDARYYFVHSYYVLCQNRNNVVATTEYGVRFDSIIQQGNIVGTQFHPEKSHKFGMKIFKNFLEKY